MIAAWGLLLLLEIPAPPLFAGVATRDAAATEASQRASLALAQGLEKRDVLDLATPPPAPSVSKEDPAFAAAVKAALARYQDAELERARDKADEAITRFEGSLAFIADAPWPIYAQALVVKSLAERKLGNDAGADAALLRLAVVLPRMAPDPTLAPPRLVQRHTELLDELRSKPRVQIEVVSSPSGAKVMLDGVAQGIAPLVVRDLLPGVHFVSLEREGVRVEKRVDATAASTRVDAVVGDVRTDAARRLRAALAAAEDEAHIKDLARAVGDDVLVGLLMPAGAARETNFVLVRVHAGELRVAGAVVDDRLPTKARLLPLADALLEDVVGPEGVWIPAMPGSPRDVLFETGTGVHSPPTASDEAAEPEAEDADVPWIAVGLGAGGLLVVGAAAAVTTLVLLQRAQQVEMVVDASKL